MMDQGRAVGMALQEMHPGYRRQALELVHGEAQRTIDQAMDREAMLLGIDLGEVGRVVLHKVEAGRRNDSHIVLQWGVVGDVIDAHSDATARGYASRRWPVLVQVSSLSFGLGGLAPRPLRANASTCRHASQCASAFQEPPAAGTIRIHERLPSSIFNLSFAWPEVL